jgi:CDP-diacylglycerol---glycerol-3-phosphate 3-phosphatidyltransferase
MSMTWTSTFGRGCGVLLDAIVRWLALARINPNVLTFLGLVVNTIAAFLFGYANGDSQARMFRYAGLVIIGSGFFDLVDGRVARASNQVTRFGGFFDSVIDRYSDASQFFGLLVFYSRSDRFFYVVLTAFVMVSSIMVSYTRARAESLIGSCRVGFMERPERLVLVIIGALFNRMAPVLWLIAVHRDPSHPLHLHPNRGCGCTAGQGWTGRVDLSRRLQPRSCQYMILLS